ncbi:hypothetical protein LguiA_018107 [Lonicera macranthoides]
MSQRYDLELRCRDDVKWNIPPGKGALLLFDILVLKASKTKIRTTEGQIIALGDNEITSPPVRARVAIYSNALAIPSVSERYVLNELSNLDIDAFSRDYLVKAIVTCAVDIISTRTKGKDNDTTTGFKVDGKLKVTGEEVIDETRVLGGMKKEVFEGGDGDWSNDFTCKNATGYDALSDEYSLVWRNGSLSDEYSLVWRNGSSKGASHIGSWGILGDPYK